MRCVLASFLVALVVLSGCSKKQETNAQKEAEIIAETKTMTPEQITSPNRVLVETTFTCVNNSQFIVQFKPGEANIILPKSKPIIMKQQPGVTGFWYKNTQYDLRGAGRTANLTVAGHKPISCTAK